MKRSSRRPKTSVIRNFTTKIDGVKTKIKVEQKGNKIFFTGNPENSSKKMEFYLDTKDKTAYLLNGTKIGKLEKNCVSQKKKSSRKKKTISDLSKKIPKLTVGQTIQKIQKESKSLVKIQLEHEIEKMKVEMGVEKIKINNKHDLTKYVVMFTLFVFTMFAFWKVGMFNSFGIFLKELIGTKLAEKALDNWVSVEYYKLTIGGIVGVLGIYFSNI